MKKIGFIDYYLSEWHANHYPAWFETQNAKQGTDYCVAYAWAELDVSPLDRVSTDEWCEKMHVTRCDTVAELCEKSDVIVILAPSNPETHLRYAQKVLPYGKPTYIDKTFAPNYETAMRIFDIAKQCGTPFFSSSALRYADELRALYDVRYLTVTGGGSDFAEYLIHLAEIAVSVLNDTVEAVRVERQGKQRVCRVCTENGKQATLLYAPKASYTVEAEDSAGTSTHAALRSAFFEGLIADILRFFETRQTSFDTAQTTEVARLCDALLAADDQEGEWIVVKDGCFQK